MLSTAQASVATGARSKRLPGACAFVPLAISFSMLLDYLVGTCHQCRRDVNTERLGCLEINDELKPACLIDGEIGRAGAFQDSVHIDRRTAVVFSDIRPI